MNIEPTLIKYLTGSATPEERAQALDWIKKSPDNQKYFDELKDYYQLSKVIQKPSGFNKTEGWQRVKDARANHLFKAEIIVKEKQFVKRLIYISVTSAAAIIFAFFLGNKLNNSIDLNEASKAIVYNEIEVPFGSKSQVTLSDGTKVWINAGSKLRYPINFSTKERKVFLEGEAFFDVTKMPGKQFIVNTSNLNIKVFGTQFNVKAYKNEDQIQTTLVKGSVAIEPVDENNNKYVYYLKPNQTATYFKTSSAVQTTNNKSIDLENQNNISDRILVVNKIDPKPIISWKDAEWIFMGENLGEMAIKLERRYNVKISFSSESLKNYKFSGTLTDETFEQVLRIIQLSAPIVFYVDGNKVVFKENEILKKKYDQMISN